MEDELGEDLSYVRGADEGRRPQRSRGIAYALVNGLILKSTVVGRPALIGISHKHFSGYIGRMNSISKLLKDL